MRLLASALIALFSMTCLARAQAPAAQGVQPESRSPAPKPEAPAVKPTLPALSESKFLALLYTEISRHTPEKSPAGDGEVTASFHVNAQGKVDKVVIDKATNPRLGEEVKKILAQVQAPPPPGGSEDIGQTFKFHAE
ncbi:MAG TPA: energy transducer TonB [Methylocystis sp.]|nr:energy transducer TonB [Methylocystis sp.]